MNLKFWLKAIQIIPRINREEWDQLDIISRWLVATRAAALFYSLFCSIIAGLLAARDGMFDLNRWLLLTIGLVFAHATNNLLNDLTDYRKGVDVDNYFRTRYGPQPIQQGLMSIRQNLIYSAITGMIALAAGLPLVILSGKLGWILLITGIILVLFYTYPLKYIGLGEIAVLLVWGPLMVGGGYYVISGVWSWPVVLISIPFALGTTTTIFGKHIDKVDEDKTKHIHTLPVIIGEKPARIADLVMMLLMYLIVIYLVTAQYLSPWILIVLLALKVIPKVVLVFHHPKPDNEPAGYPPGIWPLYYVASAFYHSRIYGALFMAGLALDLIFRVN